MEFGGDDLLHLYNREQLRTRLVTAGQPVTGLGSVAALTGTVATGLSASNRLLGLRIDETDKVAFILEVRNMDSANSVIVGLRVNLPDATTPEGAHRWPSFLQVPPFFLSVCVVIISFYCNREVVYVLLWVSYVFFCCWLVQVSTVCVHVTAPQSGGRSRFVDIVLSREDVISRPPSDPVVLIGR